MSLVELSDNAYSKLLTWMEKHRCKDFSEAILRLIEGFEEVEMGTCPSCSAPYTRIKVYQPSYIVYYPEHCKKCGAILDYEEVETSGKDD